MLYQFIIPFSRMACDEKADERAGSRAALVDTSRQKPARYDCRRRPAKDSSFGRKKTETKKSREMSLIVHSCNVTQPGKEGKTNKTKTRGGVRTSFEYQSIQHVCSAKVEVFFLSLLFPFLFLHPPPLAPNSSGGRSNRSIKSVDQNGQTRGRSNPGGVHSTSFSLFTLRRRMPSSVPPRGVASTGHGGGLRQCGQPRPHPARAAGDAARRRFAAAARPQG